MHSHVGVAISIELLMALSPRLEYVAMRSSYFSLVSTGDEIVYVSMMGKRMFGTVIVV